MPHFQQVALKYYPQSKREFNQKTCEIRFFGYNFFSIVVGISYNVDHKILVLCMQDWKRFIYSEHIQIMITSFWET